MRLIGFCVVLRKGTGRSERSNERRRSAKRRIKRCTFVSEMRGDGEKPGGDGSKSGKQGGHKLSVNCITFSDDGELMVSRGSAAL